VSSVFTRNLGNISADLGKTENWHPAGFTIVSALVGRAEATTEWTAFAEIAVEPVEKTRTEYIMAGHLLVRDLSNAV